MLEIMSQRLNYLINGNWHGVGSNWLSKNLDSISDSIFNHVVQNENLSQISSQLLLEGEMQFSIAIKEKTGVNYSSNFDCEKGLASFLYAFILTYRPSLVVETGVANGITTNVMMKALEITGGSLHSYDVDLRTKNVYSGNGLWYHHHLGGNLKKSLINEISKLPKIDLWVHDSNHGYSWQSFEFNLASKNLSSNGTLCADDIDSSTAWGLITPRNFQESAGVFDHRKMFGIATGSKVVECES